MQVHMHLPACHKELKLAKKLACALTHIRQETYFLEKWIEHYGRIVGRENLHVVLDGDDWTPAVDLEGINVSVMTDAPRERIRNDRFIAKTMSQRANFLRKSYSYVIRTDVDEFVCIDPRSENGATQDWEAALREVDELSYIFALGMDVIQRGPDLAPIKDGPVLAQRPYGVISPLYSKPFVINRWNNWAGGAHRLINRKVVISNQFFMFHLALADLTQADIRHTGRGGDTQHGSHTSYQAERFAKIYDAPQLTEFPFEEACAMGRAEFSIGKDGEAATRPKQADDFPILWTRLPEEFQSLL